MKSEPEIKAILADLRNDIRLSYPTATIVENAPLALEQLAAESKIALLQRILELPCDLSYKPL